MSKYLSEGDDAYEHDNVFSVASRALETAQEEIKQWRIRAEDAEKGLEEREEELLEVHHTMTHLRRIHEIQDQIIEQKELAIAAYKNMVEDLQSAGMVHRQSEEILELQTKLKFALSCVPRGDNDEGFSFENGDVADYGSECSHTEFMVSYWQQALPLAMSCINRVHALLHADVDIEKVKQVIEATKDSLRKTHDRTQVGEEICQFSGKGRRHYWMLPDTEGCGDEQ